MSKDKFPPREYKDIVLGYNAKHFVEMAMKSNENTIATEEEMTKAEQMNAILEAAFLIAVADGELTDKEIAALSKAAARLFEATTEEKSPYREAPDSKPSAINEEYINASLQSFADLLDEQSYAQRIAYIAEALPSDELRQQAFRLAVDLAMIEGKVSDDENKVIQELATAFTFTTNKTHQLLQQMEAARK